MESGLARAWRRAGHDVRLIDDRRARRVLSMALTQRWARWHARRFRPDFVFVGKGLGLAIETLAGIVGDRPSAMWLGDAPYWRHVHDQPHPRHYLEVGKAVDVMYVFGFEREWSALGADARFLPPAADREIVPAPPLDAMRCDLTFIGTGYEESRAAFLLDLARHFHVKVWGGGWERWADRLDWGERRVEGKAFSQAVSSAGAVLGINPRVAEGATRYASNRMWTSILGGGFYLGELTPGIDELLHDDVHCAWYADLASCVERARHYLAHPAERERVRAAGERFVREHHTFDQRAATILGLSDWENPLG